MLPPAPLRPPASKPAPKLSRTDQITRYIQQYDGGDCFFISPVAVSAGAAQIEGFGAAVEPFQALDDAFKQATGFEADIGLRQIAAAQCPAVAFLRRLQDRAAAPRLKIGETNLRPGQSLTGTVEGYGKRHVELLLVSDSGSVQNVSSTLKPAAQGKAFALRAQRKAGNNPQPQLVIAVASARPLASLKLGHSVPAEQLFPQVVAEAEQTGQAVGAEVKYFKLER